MTLYQATSPCVSICSMDLDTDLCLGCFRNTEEIASWSEMSEEEKRKVLDALLDRKRTFYPGS